MRLFMLGGTQRMRMLTETPQGRSCDLGKFDSGGTVLDGHMRLTRSSES